MKTIEIIKRNNFRIQENLKILKYLNEDFDSKIVFKKQIPSGVRAVSAYLYETNYRNQDIIKMISGKSDDDKLHSKITYELISEFFDVANVTIKRLFNDPYYSIVDIVRLSLLFGLDYEVSKKLIDHLGFAWCEGMRDYDRNLDVLLWSARDFQTQYSNDERNEIIKDFNRCYKKSHNK